MPTLHREPQKWEATIPVYKDTGPEGRPTYGSYTWADTKPPRGGPTPRADGYVMGSEGHDFILPPMPPVRSTDIHRANSVAANNAIRSCFWPGPKLRPGFYTTDPDDYGLENQLPDTGNTFSTAWFKIPEGAKIVMKGDFPAMRHWSYTTYSTNGVPRDVIDDVAIDPDAGSFNPFRPGVARDAKPRKYAVAIMNGDPPSPRPANTVYTRAPAMTDIGMHMRNYVPDRSVDWAGGVGVPQVELHLADGKVLTGQEACDATAAPLREKQVPLPIPTKNWVALTRLPWMPADHTAAKNFEVATMTRFFNREHLLTQTFFPAIPSDGLAVEKGGFWSNFATRYGFTYLSQANGSVYVVHGKMPTTPKNWDGTAKPLDQSADMRYWSICTGSAPPTGMTVDCVHDENMTGLLDPQGNFNVVVTRAPDRPANATEKCGVVWMEYGNGDGIPGGSKDFGVVINRHTHVNPKFEHSWFAVKKPNAEGEIMGDYLPKVLNLHDKARFEALGCPVDTTKLAAMAMQNK